METDHSLHTYLNSQCWKRRQIHQRVDLKPPTNSGFESTATTTHSRLTNCGCNNESRHGNGDSLYALHQHPKSEKKRENNYKFIKTGLKKGKIKKEERGNKTKKNQRFYFLII